MLEVWVGVEFLGRAVVGPPVLDDGDGLGVETRGVQGLEDETGAVESEVVGAGASPRVGRAGLVPRVSDERFDAL